MLFHSVEARASRWLTTPRVLAALLATATALSPGCVYGPGDESIGTTAQALLSANAGTAFDYFVGQGLTADQAAGIVGNLVQESNVVPTAVQAGGPGRGIAQWSVGGRWDTDSGDNVVAYAASRGMSEWSLSLQLDFIWYELTHFSGYGLADLRAATTVTAATIAFEVHFEGCGECDQATRITYANEALTQFGADADAWGAQFVSQSFPYAAVGDVSIPAGGTHSISITMQNIGSHAWDDHTCIGTTVPRDNTSVFADAAWPGANRPACVPAGTTVAHGANHTFTWVMHAPATAGRYDEHWGMVEDGVAWFSDPGEGGPPDTDLEGIFTVTAAPPAPDAGVHDAGIEDVGHDAGEDVEHAIDAGPGDDVTETVTDAGAGEDVAETDVTETDVIVTADVTEPMVDGGTTDATRERVDGGLLIETPAGCGCSTQGPTGGAGSQASALLVAAAAFAGTRRRRPR